MLTNGPYNGTLPMIKGRSIVHCHGRDKGKVLRTYRSHAAAVRAHRAIMASKKKRGKKR